MKLFILFYADDTVILAESANDLQFINIVILVFAVKWKLTVNICKTKIVVFSRGRQPKFVLTHNCLPVEIATDFNFLGVVF